MSPARPNTPADHLTTYRAKRSAERTPEPFGVVEPEQGFRYVVHKHAARRLHYDLRLEMEGVLRSWAVPRGPSYNPADKRLAVHVEDHPLEYGDFEGMIPEGNYGAGAVIVWDRGRWTPLEDPLEGLKKGKLLFLLEGHKLHGRWTMVKIKKGQKDWLLIKERDQYATSGDGERFPQDSVLSGLTVEELKEGKRPGAELRAKLEAVKAPKRELRVKDVELMLAETRDEPFSRKGWIFELKYDGYRLLAARERGDARLLSRNGNDMTVTFPDVARAVQALPFDGVILDGEVVVVDVDGRPSFGRLQQRAKLTRPGEVRVAAIDHPATFFAFDLLACEGFDLRGLPLLVRKQLLKEMLPEAGVLRYTDHIEEQGETFFGELMKLNLEGMVGKDAAAPYKAGRSSSWIKVRADKTDDFVVVGYSEPKGKRAGFGAIHLAEYVDGELTYSGRAGSGFTAKQIGETMAEFEKTARPDPPCVGPIPKEAGTKWVEPKLVAEVRYRERTSDGLLRQPVFVRFRDDKRPEECLRRGTGDGLRVAGGARPKASEQTPATHNPQPAPREIKFSNLEKIYWPDEGYTKGNLIEYYRAISPWLLKWLEERPLVMTRFPDGITGKNFFQKDAPGFAPDWFRREKIWSEDTQRDISYFVCDSLEALLYVANMGTIPIHIWASRLGSLETPDWCVIDIDPKEAPFGDVVTLAKTTRDVCKDIGLDAFVKTTGSSGLHVLLPLGRQVTYEQCRTIGQLVSQVVVSEHKDIATLTRSPSRREGKVYLDYVQNGHGRLIVSAYSVRPLPGAPISMPLKWSEVGAKLSPRQFTIKNAIARMKKLKTDPAIEVLEVEPDLHSVLGRLAKRYEKAGK